MTQATANTDAGLQDEVKRLRAENKELRDNDIKQLTDAKAEVETKLDDAKARIVELENEAKTEKEKSEQELTAANDKIKELTEQLEAEKASAKELNEQLAAIKAEKEDERRRHALSEKLELTGEDADSMLKGMASLSAEAFDAQVEFLAKAMAKSTSAPTAPKSTSAQDPPQSTSAPAPLKTKAGEDPNAAHASTDSIDEAEPTADPALNVSDADDEVQSTRQAIAAYFGCDEDE